MKNAMFQTKRGRKKTLQCYLIMSTQIIGFFVFSMYPLCWAAQKAWFFYSGTPSQTHFVGWDNFITIFTRDATYWTTWLTTIEFAIYKIPIELTLAMAIALCLHGKLKGAGFFRTMYYMPCIVSVAIVGLVFTNLFDYFGFINAWLIRLGLISKNIDWFASKATAMGGLVAGSIWNTFGTNVLYFIAALSNIPEEVYESAKLDGASGWTIFRKITIPLMGPILSTILLLSINGTLHTSDYILTFTNGAPHGSTFTVMAYQVSKFLPGFADAGVNIGYGCAMGIVSSLFFIAIALGYRKLSAKLQNMY